MPAIDFAEELGYEEIAKFHAAAADIARRAARGGSTMPAIYGTGASDSPGHQFTKSRAYTDWLKKYPDGTPPGGLSVQSDPVQVGSGMRALITSADASAGTLVSAEHLGLLDPGLMRPLTVKNLVTIVPTKTDSVEYAREASRVKAAAPVAEATALTGTSGTKPEGGLTFQLVTAVVRTIAEWVPATKRILSDAAQLRAYIDQFLSDDVSEELEDQMVAGNGTGENFLGILNQPGVQTSGPPSGGQSMLHTLRRALKLVRTGGRTTPNGILLHPDDAETLDLLTKSANLNDFVLGVGPFSGFQRSVWSIPVVESESVPSGTALVGDFRKAVMFDREQTSISVGTAMDDFVRNVVRVLAELRAAFGVVRPAAFVVADLVA